MKHKITILLFEDVEKPTAMVRRWFDCVRELSGADARIQVIAISQRDNSPELESQLQKNNKFALSVVYADQPRANDGYPIWDILKSVRDVWDKVDGEYVTFSHMEYMHGVDSLAGTCEWLEDNRPIVAMGNLRRVGNPSGDWKQRVNDENDEVNDLFSAMIDDGLWLFLRNHWHDFPTKHWIYWADEPSPESTNWGEDIFYARRDFLELTRFFTHGGEQPFQDVYDLMYRLAETLMKLKLCPAFPRIPLTINSVYHINHARTWGSYKKDVYQWFLRDKDKWKQTTHGTRLDLWRKALNGSNLTTGSVVSDFRRARGGTVTRWYQDFSKWATNGGQKELAEYYNSVLEPELV